MYIKNQTVANFFGIEDSRHIEKFDAFNQKLEHGTADSSHIILLGFERTLYDYLPKDIIPIYDRVRSQVLLVLCQGLSSPIGNGERKWINTQGGISNFNVNIFTTLPQFDGSNTIWSLQEQISTAIAETLAGNTPGKKVEIAFPFHYLLDGKKVAGHLIQITRKNTTQNFVRIGIGVNSTLLPPKLPENDQLAQVIYNKTASLCIPPKSWISFAERLSENILSSVQKGSQHTTYLEYLDTKSGQDVSVFSDNGSTQLGEKLAEGRFQTIQPTGSIVVDDTIFPSGKNYHIKKN